MTIVTADAMRRFETDCFAAGSAMPEGLMAEAGRGAADCFHDFFRALPPAARRRVIIAAGHRNNGGDGIVMAGHLARELKDTAIELHLVCVPDKLSSAARHFYSALPRGVPVHCGTLPQFRPGDVIVDALLGTGLSGNLREPYRSWIARLNASRCPVFSVDLPSGLGSDCYVQADMTAAIGWFKDSLFTPEGARCAGRLRRIALTLPGEPERCGTAIDAEAVARRFRRLDAAIHKYQKGSVLLLGGSVAYPHAPFLSGRAALRAGAGMVRLLTPAGVTIPGGAPLALIVSPLSGNHGFFSGRDLDELSTYTARVDVVAVGPGLGRHESVRDFLAGIVKLPLPLVLDADALYFAAEMADAIRARTAPTVLTPHAGEAALLAAGAGVSSIPNDPVADARSLADAYAACIVRKGCHSVIALPGGHCVRNSSGCPALATAGSGDCLTGMIAAALAGDSAGELLPAVAEAVFLHGLAGELAAEVYGMRGVIADDLPELIPAARRSITPFA